MRRARIGRGRGELAGARLRRRRTRRARGRGSQRTERIGGSPSPAARVPGDASRVIGDWSCIPCAPEISKGRTQGRPCESPPPRNPSRGTRPPRLHRPRHAPRTRFARISWRTRRSCAISPPDPRSSPRPPRPPLPRRPATPGSRPSEFRQPAHRHASIHAPQPKRVSDSSRPAPWHPSAIPSSRPVHVQNSCPKQATHINIHIFASRISYHAGSASGIGDNSRFGLQRNLPGKQWSSNVPFRPSAKSSREAVVVEWATSPVLGFSEIFREWQLNCRSLSLMPSASQASSLSQLQSVQMSCDMDITEMASVPQWVLLFSKEKNDAGKRGRYEFPGASSEVCCHGLVSSKNTIGMPTSEIATIHHSKSLCLITQATQVPT